MPANLTATFGDDEYDEDALRQEKLNDDMIVFQGLIFDINGDITKPKVVHSSGEESTIEKQKKLIDFLTLL